ncbi:Snf7-domain-containing protein [Morchella snyderi]|nr:Snf7-domain-containing protein [Morchella snyderi]
MWSMLFGPSAAKKKDIPKKAILDVRQQLEMLQKKEKHLEQQIEEQDNIARKFVQTNKTAAMTALKRKKMHVNHLASTQSQIATLEQQMHAVETANLNVETLKVMKNASNAMKVIHGGMNVDKVDETMEEIREQQHIADEISNAIININDASEDDDLKDQLDALEQEVLDDKMLGAPSAPITSTPHIIKGKVPIREEEDDEEELRKLRAEMAIAS